MFTNKYKKIVVLTGAGISAESGIKTFRDQNGLWENHRIEDVASPEGFARNPELVHNFYNLRRKQLLDPTITPNKAHYALVELEEFANKNNLEYLLVTQNVDNLHERAGSKKILHMHGELQKIICMVCDKVFDWKTDLTTDNECPSCKIKKSLRPHIVWFGEMPLYMDLIYQKLDECDLFIAIGTSGNVYPAAGFVQIAHRAHKIEVNLRDSEISNYFNEHYVGPASAKTDELIKKLIN